MKSIVTSLRTVVLAVGLVAASAGCAHMPGGVAASTTPLEGRKYTNLGPARQSDSRIALFGILPISGSNTIRGAIRKAVSSRGGDAMINVTVEAYSQYWILFSRDVTAVEGDVIRFE